MKYILPKGTNVTLCRRATGQEWPLLERVKSPTYTGGDRENPYELITTRDMTFHTKDIATSKNRPTALGGTWHAYIVKLPPNDVAPYLWVASKDLRRVR